MSDRRDFIKGSLLAGSALLLTGVSTANATPAAFTNIVYTSTNPGKWGKKVGSHLPSISVEGNKVTVFTKHGMAENIILYDIHWYLRMVQWKVPRSSPQKTKKQNQAMNFLPDIKENSLPPVSVTSMTSGSMKRQYRFNT